MVLLQLKGIKVSNLHCGVVTNNKNGKLFTSLVASGHANCGTKGNDIPCAVISSCLASFCNLVASDNNFNVVFSTTGEGNLAVKFEAINGSAIDYLVGLQNSLLSAIEFVQKEYPKSVRVKWDSKINLDCQIKN